MTFRERLHTAGKNKRVRTGIWVGSLVLAVLLAVALLIVAVLTYQRTRRPPGRFLPIVCCNISVLLCVMICF